MLSIITNEERRYEFASYIKSLETQFLAAEFQKARQQMEWDLKNENLQSMAMAVR